MKQKLLSIVCFLSMTIAAAQTFTVNSIEYKIAGSSVQLTKGTSASGVLTIPSSVVYNTITYPVTSIGEMAFAYNYSLTSVIIPNSVVTIGESAFDSSVLESIVIPNSVTSIGSSAFAYCGNLTSITIPNSVTSIGSYAFSDCKKITSVVIPASMTSIPSGIFYGCDNLTSVTIPNTIISIGGYAFSLCKSLTSITCGITTPFPISVDVFYKTNKAACLLDVPVSSKNAYKALDEWKDFKGISDKQTFTVNNVNYTIIGNTKNVEVADSQCYSAGNLIIPSTVVNNSITYNVTAIGNNAFQHCFSISSVTIPNSVTSIGDNAFYNCGNLASVSIPNSVTSIGASAFDNANKITSITIPASVVSIGEGAFRFCSKITSITIPSSIKSIGNSVFESCYGLTSITIPSSVTSIGDSAFESCAGLTSITIPSSVTSIGSSAFNNCSNLTSITLPNTITVIEDFLFSDCKKLTSVNIPNSVTSIKDFAFYSCTSLASITIPASVASIKYAAFANCTNLTSVSCAIAIPLSIDPYVFQGVNIAVCDLIVPASSENTYKTTAVWKDFKSVKGTLSTDQFVKQQNVLLYPNPFSNELFLELSSTDSAKVEVLDINGKAVLNKTVNTASNTIDTSNLSSGIYFAKVSDGNNTSIQKVIKK